MPLALLYNQRINHHARVALSLSSFSSSSSSSAAASSSQTAAAAAAAVFIFFFSFCRAGCVRYRVFFSFQLSPHERVCLARDRKKKKRRRDNVVSNIEYPDGV